MKTHDRFLSILLIFLFLLPALIASAAGEKSGVPAAPESPSDYREILAFQVPGLMPAADLLTRFLRPLEPKIADQIALGIVALNFVPDLADFSFTRPPGYCGIYQDILHPESAPFLVLALAKKNRVLPDTLKIGSHRFFLREEADHVLVSEKPLPSGWSPAIPSMPRAVSAPVLRIQMFPALYLKHGTLSTLVAPWLDLPEADVREPGVWLKRVDRCHAELSETASKDRIVLNLHAYPAPDSIYTRLLQLTSAGMILPPESIRFTLPKSAEMVLIAHPVLLTGGALPLISSFALGQGRDAAWRERVPLLQTLITSHQTRPPVAAMGKIWLEFQFFLPRQGAAEIEKKLPESFRRTEVRNLWRQRGIDSDRMAFYCYCVSGKSGNVILMRSPDSPENVMNVIRERISFSRTANRLLEGVSLDLGVVSSSGTDWLSIAPQTGGNVPGLNVIFSPTSREFQLLLRLIQAELPSQ